MRVYNTLGEFSNVRNNLVDSSTQRRLLGIPQLPMTPVDNRTQARFPPTQGLNGKMCPSGLNKQQNEMQSWRGQAGQSKPHPVASAAPNRLGNSALPGHGNKSNDNSQFKTQNASHAGSKQGINERLNTKVSDKTKPTASKSGNRGQSKSRTSKSSAADSKSSESHSGPPNGAIYGKIKKEFVPRDPQQQQRYDAKKVDSRRMGQELDSRTESGSMSRKADSSHALDSKPPTRSMFDLDDDDFGTPMIKQEKPRPRLDIPTIMVCISSLFSMK